MTNKNKLKIAFFGTSEISVIVLNELKKSKLTPKFIITAHDKPKGRKLKLTPSPVKVWAKENKIDFIQPDILDDALIELLRKKKFDIFAIVSYGKIFKKEFLEIPKYGSLNMHPSLLPKFRGPSPIVSTILEDEKKTGVTIMLMDAGIDSGPILAQKIITLKIWPPKISELEEILAREGGKLLSNTIPKWIAGKIKTKKQKHDKATFTKKIMKEDGLINLEDSAYKNLLKIKAFEKWPGTYFFITTRDNKKQAKWSENHASKRVRIKIIDADIKNSKLDIKRVIPEGKKEMDYKDFLRGQNLNLLLQNYL